MYSARWLPAKPVIPVIRTRIARKGSKSRASARLPAEVPWRVVTGSSRWNASCLHPGTARWESGWEESEMRWLLAVVSTIALTITTASVAFAETFDNPQGNFNWKVYDYNASGQALSSRQPFLVSEPDGGIAFNFLYTPDTALFMTGHPSYRGDLVGDLSSKKWVSAK